MRRSGWLYRRFRNLSIGKKLYFIIAVQIAVLLVWYLSMLLSRIFGEVEKQESANLQLAGRMGIFWQNQVENLYSISAFPILRDSNGQTTDIYKYFASRAEDQTAFPFGLVRSFETSMTGVLGMNSDVARVAAVNAQGYGIYMDSQGLGGDALLFHTDMEQDWVEAARERRGSPVLVNRLDEGNITLPATREYIYCARAIVYAEQYQIIGVALTAVKRSLVDRAFERERIFPEQSYLLFTGEGEAVAGTLSLELLPAHSAAGTWKGEWEGQPYSFSRYDSPDGAWGVLVGTPARLIYGKMDLYFWTLLVTLATLIAGTVALSASAVRSIRRPVRELLEVIGRYGEGDFSAKSPVEGRDELAVLAGAFNDMSARVGTLIEEGYKKDIQRREYELQVLKHQVNPHFLYNTLDSARMAAYLGGDHTVAEMLTLLSDLLRYGLVGDNAAVPLEMELKNITDYIRIVNLRQNGQVALQINVEEGCMSCPVPRLTLQPLVENCVNHGFSDGRAGGAVMLFGYRAGRDVILKVTDNGMGAGPETVRRLRERLEEDRAEDSGQGIGLVNVHRRLRLLMGEHYGIQVEGAEGRGFAVTLTLPGEGGGAVETDDSAGGR